MLKHFTEKKVENLLFELHNEFGKIESNEKPSQILFTTLDYKTRFEKQRVNIRLSFNAEFEVTELSFLPVTLGVEYPEITKDSSIDDIAAPYIYAEETSALIIGIYENGNSDIYSYGTISKKNTDEPEGGTIFKIGSAKAKSYEELLRKKVPDEIGMNSTVSSLSEKQLKKLAPGHTIYGKEIETMVPSSLSSSNQLYSNCEDLLKYLESNITGSSYSILQNIETVPKTGSYKDKTRRTSRWRVKTLDSGDNLIWQSSQTEGYSSYIGFIKKKKIGIVILSNSANSVDEVGKLILKLMTLPP